MHKSAMQLQQQQQQAAAVQQAAQNHHLGQHGQLIRAGSSSGSESGALSKPHQCQQCLKAFSSNHQLVQHIRVHTGEKPYKCSYCDRRFKQLSHVQQHTRLHTGERPYKCHLPECGRAFIQLSNLQQHLRNHDAQLERSKNRPFHCNICGKGFATESSLRTHTSKVCKDQHSGLIGGPNLVSCPICHKPFYGGEALMDHMKHTHKDPNASGVATKRRTANHPCPVCGKHYVNEGSLRKHLTCHPETAQLGSSLRMWPCPVCQAVFTHENGLLTHMEQMRMDPKHQFAAQYTLSRAAAERRERENILAAAAVAAMAQAGGHHFPGNQQNQGLQHGSLGTLLPMPPSPSGSESSGRLSSPLDTNNSGLSHPSGLQHSRMNMSSPVNNGPLELTRGHHQNGADARSKEYGNSVGMSGHNTSGDSSNNVGGRDEHQQNSHHPPHLPPPPPGHHHPGHHGIVGGENGMVQSSNKLQDAMKMAAMLSGPNGQNGPNLIHHQNPGDMMSPDVRMQAEALFRSQAEALRLAVENHNSSNNNNNPAKNNAHANQNGGSSPNSANNNSSSAGHNGPNGEIMGNHTNSMLAQHAQAGHHPAPPGNHPVPNGHSGHHRIPDHHRMDAGLGQPGNLPHSMANPHHLHHSHPALNHHPHQLNSILSQQQSDLSEALMRLDARTLGFPLPAHNS